MMERNRCVSFSPVIVCCLVSFYCIIELDDYFQNYIYICKYKDNVEIEISSTALYGILQVS